MTNGAKPGKGKRSILSLGVGCVSLIAMCCLSAGGVALYTKNSKESRGRAYAERFLGLLQQQNWSGAFGAAVYAGDSGLHRVETFTACLQQTPLASVASYDCGRGAESSLTDDHVTITCAVTTASGVQDVAVGVNLSDLPPPGDAYLGFVWFRATAPVGPQWHSEDCATWSGKMYFEQPPEGFIRP